MRARCEFQVIDETADWIVVDKPAPLAVHPSNGRTDEPTLLGGLEALLACELAGGGHLSILTRLDRETSGLVLVAKNRGAARHFSRQLERREVEKEYVALVHGWPAWDERVADGPILRAGELEASEIWLRQRVHPDGRPCATGLRVEARFANAHGRFSRIRCRPQTGRMHQIRVHLADAGHPIIGDKVYCGDGSAYLEQISGGMSADSAARMILPRQALHATRLGADWEGRHRTWDAPMPPDLARFAAAAEVEPGHGEPGETDRIPR